MRLPFVIHITRKNARSVFTMDRAFLFYVPPLPQTVLKVPARVEKSVPHYRGDYEFSILTGGTFTFKTVSPRLSEKSRREQKSLYPTTGATTDSQSSLGGTFTFKTVSPTTSVCKGIFDVFGAHLGCLPAMVFSGRISGVCLQRCIRCASQVFAIDGNGHRPCKRLGHSQPFLT